jgi:selenocysteine-specific elongation factor
MTSRPFILATAGHVDHGKSALVKALTGTDPDRLPEEKARGITIELGFAHLELPDPDNPAGATTNSLGIVDVPGHEDFVKNMVAGVGSIDLALLVVAADDGWMPQTEEHLQILEYLGVNRGVVALTKCDLATDLDTVAAMVREQLRGSALADAPVLPTSIVTRDQGRPRLAVDRAFVLKGLGTVVTGTLSGGRLAVGQEVTVQPGGLLARVRSIQSHNEQLTEARPGMRTALNLPDVALAAPGQPGIARGDAVTVPGGGVAASTWQVRLSRSARLAGQTMPATRPLKSGLRLQVHHGSACHPARLRWLEQIEWGPGATALAELNFEAPVFALAGDRFVLRDWSERATLAGGLVLVPAATLKLKRGEHLVTSLRRLAASMHDGECWLEAALAMEAVTSLPGIVRVSPFGGEELRQAAGRLIGDGRARSVGEFLVAGEAWRDWLAAAQSLVRDFHREHPEKPGLPVAGLRAQFQQLDEPVFQALLEALVREGCVREGAIIRTTRHALKLPPELDGAGRRVRRLLNEKPLGPPSRKELAPDAVTQKVLRFLIDAGEAVDLGPELVLSAAAYRQAVDLITGHLRRTGGATVSELRPVLGTSRRILIPLLEHLDKLRVTVRFGDRRKLGGHATAA